MQVTGASLSVFVCVCVTLLAYQHLTHALYMTAIDSYMELSSLSAAVVVYILKLKESELSCAQQ